MSEQKITIEYNDKVVRQFLYATVLWGAVGMLVGVFVASQLNFWRLNFDLPWLTFGRLRPLHTNAVIFAFVGNMMFAGIYYSTQRLVKARLASDFLSQLHFWGWQAIILAAAITLPLGFSRGKEYAELIWPINVAVAFIWVVFAVNFFWTLARRHEKALYVAIWFYIATIITVAMLYIVNHLSIPTSLLHSYPVFGGVQDALVQWWYGHNAVAFFLTTPILGIMYYFVPKAAERPVYSYRLSVVHFWSLVFLYIWAGPHHLLNTALPGWLQNLGMTFSLMLWAPSWGGMLNGLLTLRGAWHKLRTDPVLKFFAAGITFYGMATFEGPLLSIKSVNALGHYTDWIIGHVHAGALGWNGFMAAGMIYWLLPRLWNKPLHSTSLANLHFWLGTVGILFYVAAMWTSGITQGLMLNATTEGGTVLAYPNFIDTLNTIRPMMLMRVIGGGMYLVGWFLLAYNLWQTLRGAQPVNGTVEVYPEPARADERLGFRGTWFNAPTLFCILGVGFGTMWMLGSDLISVFGLVGAIACFIAGYALFTSRGKLWTDWYEKTPPERPAVHRPHLHRRRRRRSHPDRPDRRHRARAKRRGPYPTSLYAARARRPRHLCPRGLLQLPLADGPHARARRPPLRRILPPRRIDLRLPLPMGLQAHRSRPRTRRRQVSKYLAPPPHGGSPLDLRRFQHAVLSLAVEEQHRRRRAPVENQRPAHARSALRPAQRAADLR
jgi:cytochrome c oxidase, cbb3-type, subunit I